MFPDGISSPPNSSPPKEITMQVFALIWSKTFGESCRPPEGSVPHSSAPPPLKLELAAGDRSLFTDQSEAVKHCGYMNDDHAMGLNDRPVEVVLLTVQ